MHQHIEEMYPEIAKAIQHRRAQYYLLIHEYHFVEEMLKKGQIEDKEAAELKGEIDAKIYYLQMHPPEIELVDHHQRIQFYSELSEVFDREDLHKAFHNVNIGEKLYNPKEQIVAAGEHQNLIFFVARGMVIEKDGDIDDFLIPSLKFHRGNIACLQNLLPFSDKDKQISDVYCHHGSIVSVVPLDLEYLKFVLTKDRHKLVKLWHILAYRLIVIHQSKLKQLQHFTQDKIKIFCKMCEIKVYDPGETIHLSSGGILFRGGLQELNDQLEPPTPGVPKEDRKLAILAPVVSPEVQSLKINELKPNDAMNASKQYQRDHVLQKRKSMRVLGSQAKELGLLTPRGGAKSQLRGIMFFGPSDQERDYLAQSSDYTVIMHFNEAIKQKILERGMTPEGIDQAFQDFQFNNFKQKNMIKNFNFQQEDANPRLTIGAKKSKKLDFGVFGGRADKTKTLNEKQMRQSKKLMVASQTMTPLHKEGSRASLKAEVIKRAQTKRKSLFKPRTPASEESDQQLSPSPELKLDFHLKLENKVIHVIEEKVDQERKESILAKAMPQKQANTGQPELRMND